MKRPGGLPLIAAGCGIAGSSVGRHVEIGTGSRILNSEIGDHSCTERFADIANATVGKFANIAGFARIGPTDHPMDRASQHSLLCRSEMYRDEVGRALGSA